MRDTNPQKCAKLIQETYLPGKPNCVEAIAAMITSLVLDSIDKHTTLERMKNITKPMDQKGNTVNPPNSLPQVEINGKMVDIQKVSVMGRRF